MGHGHKGWFVNPVTQTTTVSPVLVANGGTRITWSYAGTVPALWQVWQSTTQFGTYTVVDTVVGTVNTVSGFIVGRWEYVLGTDGSHNPITPQSNRVQVT